MARRPGRCDEQWEHWRHTAEPLSLGATLRVDTTGPVDLDTVTDWIAQHTTIRVL